MKLHELIVQITFSAVTACTKALYFSAFVLLTVRSGLNLYIEGLIPVSDTLNEIIIK